MSPLLSEGWGRRFVGYWQFSQTSYPTESPFSGILTYRLFDMDSRPNQISPCLPKATAPGIDDACRPASLLRGLKREAAWNGKLHPGASFTSAPNPELGADSFGPLAHPWQYPVALASGLYKPRIDTTAVVVDHKPEL